MKKARPNGRTTKYHRLKSAYKAKAKAVLEEYYGTIDEEAEEGFCRNNLRPAFHAIKQLGSKSHINTITATTIEHSDGTLCKTVEEATKQCVEYYEAALNHPPASLCPDLQNCAATCTPDITIPEDTPVEKAMEWEGCGIG